MMKLPIENIKSSGCFTQVKLQGGHEIRLRPFIYVKKGDILEFLPSFENFKEVNKVFKDEATGEYKKIKIYPPYCVKETIFLPPHKFEVIFRERFNSKDWEKVKELERFHYRGKGLNKLVGRRTVLLAEMEGHGIVGFGVLSATVAVAKPRFELLGTNFTNQMKTKLINRIARIPRIVIHPEFRGMNLGVLMAKHLVQYAKEYWDINHYTPIMVEVIAAMTEYHRFFEKAGFLKIGYTSGYKNGIIPLYGNGSFELRTNYKYYDFMENQKPKPYLVFPIDSNLKQKIERSDEEASKRILPKSPRLKKSIRFDRVSIKYKVKNGSTERTNIVKEVFGVDVEHAFSTILTNFSLEIEPGDVVLITGASGSGKSTIIRLLTSKLSSLKKEMEITGKIVKNIRDVAILNTNWDNSRPLIEQVKEDRNIKEAIEILNSVGLSEAHLYIKRPDQISDGQRYRFAVAKLCDSGKPIWIADEFVSTLNPEMAAIVAKGLRKVAYKNGATLILAAPHIHNFIGSLLPNKLIKLRWGAKAIIYSVKITGFAHKKDRFSLSILNNGPLRLTDIQIGLIEMNGSFKSQDNFDCINPGETITTTIEIKSSEFYALSIRTAEDVGEILYRE